MEETLNLKEVLTIIRRRLKLITLISMFAIIFSATVTFFLLTPIYQASTQILVNQKNKDNQLDLNQMQSNVSLINTYKEIIKSPVIVEKVINKLQIDQSVEQLNNNIMINTRDNSQVFSLIVHDKNAGMAVLIANTISETFQKEIKGIMNVDNVSILARAELDKNPIPVKPNPIMNIALAAIIGLMVGVGISFLLEYFDNTLKDSKDIDAYLGLPILGTIQKIPQRKARRKIKKSKMGVETFES